MMTKTSDLCFARVGSVRERERERAGMLAVYLWGVGRGPRLERGVKRLEASSRCGHPSRPCPGPGGFMHDMP